MIWKKLFNSQSSSIASAATVVASFSIISRLVGFIRDRILAGAFGASDTLDIYFAAFRIPDFLFNLLVVGALSASFIPLFTRYLGRGDEAGAWRHTNNVLNIMTLTFAVLLVIAYIFAVPLAELVAPGFDAAKQASVASMSRVMFVAQLLLAISVVYGSALQAMKRFVLYSLAPIFYNVGIIGGALLFVPLMGSIGLAWGVVLGALLHLIIQFVGVLSLGYKYSPVFDPKDRHVRQTFWQMLPRMLGLAVNQINFLAMTVIASTLAAGSVTLLQFAYNLNFFAIGAIAVPYSIAAYPTFCEQLEKNDRYGFIKSFSSTVRQILFFMIPATILFILLRAQVVRVVLGAGQFGWDETITTANTLGIFVMSLVAQSIVYILVRAYFAKGDTVTPLIMGLASAVINILAGLYFTKMFGVIGFGVAYSVAAIVQVALLWVPLRMRIGSLDEMKIASSMWILSLAGLACALVTQASKTAVVRWIPLDTFWAVLTQGLFAGLLGLAVYCLVAWFLKSEEMQDFLSGLKRKLLKKAKAPEAVVSVE